MNISELEGLGEFLVALARLALVFMMSSEFISLPLTFGWIYKKLEADTVDSISFSFPFYEAGSAFY